LTGRTFAKNGSKKSRVAEGPRPACSLIFAQSLFSGLRVDVLFFFQRLIIVVTRGHILCLGDAVEEVPNRLLQDFGLLSD